MATPAERYKAARRAKGWSQYELAQRIDRHPSTVSFIERGARPSPETAAKLDAVLGLDTERKP